MLINTYAVFFQTMAVVLQRPGKCSDRVNFTQSSLDFCRTTLDWVNFNEPFTQSPADSEQNLPRLNDRVNQFRPDKFLSISCRTTETG